MEGFGSPVKLQVLMVEKARRWEKSGKTGFIFQVYGLLTNRRPDFPLYMVVSSPYPITPGSVIDVPLSGLIISLGDQSVFHSALGEELPFLGIPSSSDDKVNKKP